MTRTFMAAASACAVTILLTGCGASQAPSSTAGAATASSRHAVTAPETPAKAPDARTYGLFGPGVPTSVVDFWHDNPTLAPPQVTQSTVLFKDAGVGTTQFTTPAPVGAHDVTLVVTCSSQAAFQVTYAHDNDPSHMHGGGGSCGGPNIDCFTSQPLDPQALPNTLLVQVPPNVHFAVAVYAE